MLGLPGRLFPLLLAAALPSGAAAQPAPRTAYTEAPRLLNGEELRALLLEAYPEHLRRAGIGGRVELRLTVDTAGRAERPALARSSGFVSLDSAALALAERLRFAPARDGSAAVPLAITFPVAFSPAIPPEHRPGEAARPPSLLNTTALWDRLRRLCRGEARAGETYVKLLVDADGAVRTLEFLDPSGWPALDRVALEIAAVARFAPGAAEDGTAVASWVVLPLACGRG